MNNNFADAGQSREGHLNILSVTNLRHDTNGSVAYALIKQLVVEKHHTCPSSTTYLPIRMTIACFEKFSILPPPFVVESFEADLPKNAIISIQCAPTDHSLGGSYTFNKTVCNKNGTHFCIVIIVIGWLV